MPGYSSKIFWGLASIGGAYALFLSLLLSPDVQRHALYAHKIHTAWYHDVRRPEDFGFAKNQVSPFVITTPDNATLFTWHVTPLGLYLKHESQFQEQVSSSPSMEPNKLAMSLLKEPNARLIINFHGNAGHIAQGWRAHAYKAISAADADNFHVLAFDYRGFGLSTGEPTEDGIITDGIAVVNWAMETAKIPPERIVLLGQSLGTAIATAVADHFASAPEPIEFAGLMLVSGFSDIPTLMKSYKIGGLVPILSPLRPYPTLQKFLSDRIVDTWDTASRLTHLTSVSKKLNLVVLHARNDFDIGWKHADLVTKAAVRGISSAKHVTGALSMDLVRGAFDDDWLNEFESGRNRVTLEILSHGGHNKIVTFASIGLYVAKLFREVADG